MTNFNLFPLLKQCITNFFGAICSFGIKPHFQLRIVIWEMKYLNSLLVASFVLLATLQQVQPTPRHCIKKQPIHVIDYCKDFGSQHLGCKNNGVSPEI